MNCSFCKQEIEQGRGSIIANRDGSVSRYCSNKCRKNANLGRNPKNMKWVTKEKKK